MDSPAIATLIRMMETLPEADQNRVVEAVRAYIAERQDEDDWDSVFKQTQVNLSTAANKARRQIKENLPQPFDLSRL